MSIYRMPKKIPFYLTLILLTAFTQPSFAKPRPIPQPFTCEELGWLAEELQSPDVNIRRDAIGEAHFRAAYAAPLTPYLADLLGDEVCPTPFPSETIGGFGNGSADPTKFSIGMRAGWALIAIGDEAIPAIAEVVKHGSLPAKLSAVGTLDGIKDPEVTTTLLIAVDDENPEVRERARQAFTPPSSWRTKVYEVKPLLQALKSPKAFNREVAMMALGQTRTSDSLEVPLRSLAVLDGLNDPAPEVRQEARKNLVNATGKGWPKAKRLLEPIIEAINDSDPQIRRAALDSAVAYGDMRAERPLLADLDSTDKYVRLSAIFNLAKLKSRLAVPPLIDMMLHSNTKEDGDIRDGIASALTTIGDPRAIAPMYKVLKDPDGKQNYSVKMWFEHLVRQSLEQYASGKASLGD